MSQPLLEVRSLSAGYGGSQVLWDIDLDMAPEKVLAIIGRNGVGKTTLLSSIVGVLPPMAGSLLLDGVELSHLAPHERARAGIGYVPQGRHIFPQLTVEENLLSGLSALGDRGSVRDGIPAFIYEMFPKLRDLLGRKGGFLSGGEQQQLAIGRALAGKPRLLLLDEPTEGIQPNIVQQIETVLSEAVRAMGITVVVVEQYLDFVWRLADNFIALDGGRVTASGSTTEFSAGEAARFVNI